jgi:tRNA(Ile)-lysidine synthase
VQIILPTGDAVAVFSGAISRLTGDKGRVLLAVSGGPDSLAMLLLAAAAIPDRLAAATVDHQLRTEAADEAEFVARLCAELGISHRTLRPKRRISGNIQASARDARYGLLASQAAESGCDWIATAHHADDQLETVLMRVARGSGVDGLSAVRAGQGQIIRPLLAFTKENLEAVCMKAGIEPVRDPSNEDTDFDRVAMRNWLATTDHPFDPLRVVCTPAPPVEATEVLEWMTDRFFQSNARIDDKSVVLDVAGLPKALKRKLLLRSIRHFGPDVAPRGDAIDRSLLALDRGERITLGNVLCEGGEKWRFRPAPPRRN